MNRRPPFVIETLVERLTPDVYRECVVGDLSETYTSVGRYLSEAARTVMFLLLGQARRAFDPVLTAAETGVLAIAFLSASASGFRPGALAAVVLALAVLGLRDTYRYPRPVLPRIACLDAIIAVTLVLLFGILATVSLRAWALETETLVRGGGLSLLTLPLVRTLFGSRDPKTPAAVPDRPYGGWRTGAIWMIAGAVLVAASSDAVPMLGPLRHPVLALTLVLALEGSTLKAPRSGLDRSWRPGAVSLYVAGLTLPFLSAVSSEGLIMDRQQLGIHVTAILMLPALWLLRRQREPRSGSDPV